MIAVLWQHILPLCLILFSMLGKPYHSFDDLQEGETLFGAKVVAVGGYIGGGYELYDETCYTFAVD
jgi:hypothetical protein